MTLVNSIIKKVQIYFLPVIANIKTKRAKKRCVKVLSLIEARAKVWRMLTDATSIDRLEG